MSLQHIIMAPGSFKQTKRRTIDYAFEVYAEGAGYIGMVQARNEKDALKQAAASEAAAGRAVMVNKL